MPRQAQGDPQTTAPESQSETPESQSETPEPPKPVAQRPRQTRQASRENRVVEGQVPQVELYVPAPIEDADLEKLNVYQRWNRMIGEMGIIPKRGWNDHHKYWFTTDADLNAFVGPLLSKYHLVVIPRLLLDQITRLETAGKQYVTRVPMEIDVINADKPDDHFTVPWAGEGGDTVDKGLYKGFTGGLKYFFMKTLQVATGDDPETFSQTDRLAEDSARAAQSGPQQGRPVQVQSSRAPQPEKGGRQEDTNVVQLRQIKTLSQALGYGPRGTAETFDRVLGTSIFDTIDGIDHEEEASRALTLWIKGLTPDDVGKVLQAMGKEIEEKASEKREQEELAEERTVGGDES